ncbi:hypothetical protein GCM10027068_21660 [Prescottella soli]
MLERRELAPNSEALDRTEHLRNPLIRRNTHDADEPRLERQMSEQDSLDVLGGSR